MGELTIVRQDDFTGGLNLRADQFQLAENESPRMLNVEIDPRGGVFSRGAMRRINSTPVVASDWNPQNCFAFNGTSNFLMLSTAPAGVSQGGVYYSTNSDATSIGVSVSSSFGAGFASWGSTLYMSTGGVGYKWGGAGSATTLTASQAGAFQDNYLTPTGTHMPIANLIATHAGKLWVANTTEGGTAHPNHIRWSHENSPESWASDDFIDINDGGQGIVAIVPFAGHLVVFKPKAVYAIFGYDSDTFQVVQATDKVGCVNSHAVIATESGVFFFSWPDGLFVYTGNQVADVFTQIRPIIQLGLVTSTSKDKIWLSNINRRIWLSLPYQEDGTSTSSPSYSFVFDPSLGQGGAYTLFRTSDNYGVAGGTTVAFTSGQVVHAALHPVQARILSVDLYSFDNDNITGTDVAFDSLYRTRFIDGGNYSQKKMFRRPDLIVKQSNDQRTLQVRVYHDYEEAAGNEQRIFNLLLEAGGSGGRWGEMVWGTDVWGAESQGSFLKTGSNLGLARSTQLEIVGSPGYSWGIDSLAFKYTPRRVRS